MRIEARDQLCDDQSLFVMKFRAISKYVRRCINHVSGLMLEKRRRAVLPVHDVRSMRDLGSMQDSEAMRQLRIDNEMQKKEILEARTIRRS